jgi:hypothetical protein
VVAAVAAVAAVALAVFRDQELAQGDTKLDQTASSARSVASGSPAAPVADGPAAPNTSGRDNSTALAADLLPGSYTVGIEIQPGHYAITTNTDETGNLRIESPVGPLKCNELLGEGEFKIGAGSYTTDLELGDLLYWQGVSTITLSPTETVARTELTPGNWVVGLDIAAGDYLAVPTGDWSGNLRVYSPDGATLVNDIIEKGEDHASISVTLADGQRVDVSGVASVKFGSPAP